MRHQAYLCGQWFIVSYDSANKQKHNKKRIWLCKTHMIVTSISSKICGTRASSSRLPIEEILHVEGVRMTIASNRQLSC